MLRKLDCSSQNKHMRMSSTLGKSNPRNQFTLLETSSTFVFYVLISKAFVVTADVNWLRKDEEPRKR
jgi:hypothetical protein